MNNSEINTLTPGQEISGTYAIRSKKILPYRDGSGFFLGLTLVDKTGQVEARVWDQAEEINGGCRVGDVVKVTGQVTEYNGTIQLRVSALEKCAEQEILSEKFIPTASIAPSEIWETWVNYAAAMENVHLKQLLTLMANDQNFIELLVQCPAAKRNHHALLGGLWLHTLGIVKAADVIAAVYRQVDRDLLIAGALLHDIGKIEEYQCRTDIDFTDAGRLLGHIVLGVGLVDRYIARIHDFPEILRLKLLHLLVSHHGNYEWQSPKRPKILEAAILHQLDMLDAQVNMFTEAAAGREDIEDLWTGWVKGLDRYIFCG